MLTYSDLSSQNFALYGSKTKQNKKTKNVDKKNCISKRTIKKDEVEAVSVFVELLRVKQIDQ